ERVFSSSVLRRSNQTTSGRRRQKLRRNTLVSAHSRVMAPRALRIVSPGDLLSLMPEDKTRTVSSPPGAMECALDVRQQRQAGRREVKPILRDVLVTALHRLGILGITKRIARSYHLQSRNLTGVAFPRFAILCYHRVGLGGVPIYSELRTSLFEAQMRF